jgi:hypothetical protein
LEAEFRRRYQQRRTGPEALDRQCANAMKAIAGPPALTRDGLRAKTAAVVAPYAPDAQDDCLSGRMMWSLVKDCPRAA